VTFDQLKTLMEVRQYFWRPEHDQFLIGRFWKKANTEHRGARSQEMHFEAALYDRCAIGSVRVPADLPDRYSFEVILTGECVRDMWVKLMAYSVRPE
jgi:hypothetical protein